MRPWIVEAPSYNVDIKRIDCLADQQENRCSCRSPQGIGGTALEIGAARDDINDQMPASSCWGS